MIHRTKLEDERRKDVVPVSVDGVGERKFLENMKEAINCEKDSTTLKFFAGMGYKLLLSNFTGPILRLMFKNKITKVQLNNKFFNQSNIKSED